MRRRLRRRLVCERIAQTGDARRIPWCLGGGGVRGAGRGNVGCWARGGGVCVRNAMVVVFGCYGRGM